MPVYGLYIWKGGRARQHGASWGMPLCTKAIPANITVTNQYQICQSTFSVEFKALLGHA